MATFEYQGQTITVVDDWRISEQIEAENALGIDLEGARSAAKMALVLFMSIRRVDTETPAGPLADQVKMMRITELAADDGADEGDAGPPDSVPEEGADEENGSLGTDAQRITGHLHSASTG